MSRSCSVHGEINVYKISVRKPQGKKVLGRPIQKDNIKREKRNRLYDCALKITSSGHGQRWALVGMAVNMVSYTTGNFQIS